MVSTERRYGGIEVNVDLSAKENRSTASLNMPLTSFLNGVNQHGWYLVDPVPTELRYVGLQSTR